MQELFVSILGGLFRYLLMALVGFLVTKGAISQELSDKLSQSQALTYYLGAAATAVLTIAWMYANKVRAKLKLDTALSLPAGVTNHELNLAVATQKDLKNLSLIAALLIPAFLFSACAPMPAAQKARWAATGSLLVQKVADIAFNTVIHAAVSQTDRTNKANLMDSLAEGFWQQRVVTSADVKNLVTIWTPEKSHWQALGNELATEFQQGVTPNQIAAGLSQSAAEARQP